MVGRVVSIKNKNTATVLVERLAKHPLYRKTYKQSKKYLVDDQLGVKLGDIVDFTNCKPISKRKSFKITKVLGKNFSEIAEEHLKEKAEAAISEVMPKEKEELGTNNKELGEKNASPSSTNLNPSSDQADKPKKRIAKKKKDK